MKDYPEINMFIQEGTDTLLVFHDNCPTGLLVVVSPFSSDKSEEENVAAIRDTYRDVPKSKKHGQTSCCLAYGEADGESFGIVIFRPSTDLAFQRTQKYCLGVAKACGQTGIITWDCDDAALLVALDGTKTKLQPWNRTLERLEQWCQHLKPGFKIKGIWNREMTYVHMRQAELKKQSPKHNH